MYQELDKVNRINCTQNTVFINLLALHVTTYHIYFYNFYSETGLTDMTIIINVESGVKLGHL